jgi:hypothetical protein
MENDTRATTSPLPNLQVQVRWICRTSDHLRILQRLMSSSMTPHHLTTVSEEPVASIFCIQYNKMLIQGWEGRTAATE